MKKEFELNQIVYNIMALQIRFGTYRFSDHLPTMDEAAKLLLVSVDTVRSAYLQLKKNGYITLTKKSGATVKLNYSNEEIEQHIQMFFSQRRSITADVGQAFRPLLCHALWLSFKNLSPDMLEKAEQLAVCSDIPPLHSMLHHLQYNYSTLKNELFLRLVLQIFQYFQAPFLSVPENMNYFSDRPNPLINMIALCRKKDWVSLYTAIEDYQDYLCTAFNDFCDRRIKCQAPASTEGFVWSTYPKPSQVCYTLGVRILESINDGSYFPNDFLPSLTQLSDIYHVSVSTVRRTLSLLNSMGIVRTIAGVGTQVLTLEDSYEMCDFNSPAVARRLFSFEQCLQLLALTCRSAITTTWAELEPEAIHKWKKETARAKETQRFNMTVFRSLELAALYSPSETVRTVYSDTIRQLFWGYPLQNMHGNAHTVKAFYIPYISTLEHDIDTGSAEGFASHLEELLYYELKITADFLVQKGICSATDLFVPDIKSDRLP